MLKVRRIEKKSLVVLNISYGEDHRRGRGHTTLLLKPQSNVEPRIKCKCYFDFFCIQVVKVLADGKVTPCYTVRGTGIFGWCNVRDAIKYSSKTYLVQVTDFDGMTKTEGMEWGFCSYHCSIAARTTMHTTKLVETMVRLENLHLCKEQFQYDDAQGDSKHGLLGFVEPPSSTKPDV